MTASPQLVRRGSGHVLAMHESCGRAGRGRISDQERLRTAGSDNEILLHAVVCELDALKRSARVQRMAVGELGNLGNNSCKSVKRSGWSVDDVHARADISK